MNFKYIQIWRLAVWLQNVNNFKFKRPIVFKQAKLQKTVIWVKVDPYKDGDQVPTYKWNFYAR